MNTFNGYISSLVKVFYLIWHAHAKITILLIIFTVAVGLIPIGMAWLSKEIFDLLARNMTSKPHIDWHLLYSILISLGILTALQNIFQAANNLLNGELGRKLTALIEQKIYYKVNGFSDIQYFESPQFHDKLRIAGQGARFSSSQVVSSLGQLTQSGTTLFSFIGVLLLASPFSAALVVMSTIPTLFAEMKLAAKRVQLAYDLSPDERRNFFYTHLLSSTYGAKEVRLFDLGDYLLKKLLSSYKKIHRAERKQDTLEFEWQSSLGVLSAIVATGALAFVVIQAFSGHLTLGDVTLYVAAITSVQYALSAIVRSIATLNEVSLFFRHFEDLLDLPPLLYESKSPTRPTQLLKGVEFRNISFTYPGQSEPTLKNVNLFIPVNTAVALVGVNGAGKTTLVKLLARLYDSTEGQILWDGVDIKEFDIVAYRKLFSTIFQDFVRYDLSAHDNIGLGNVDDINDVSRVQRAATMAGVHEEILRFPSQYDTILSREFFGEEQEIGIELSGGQWQKVALARMLMREADFLILDEPTASLDAQAEYEVFNQFASLVKGRTSLLISHRLGTVRMADMVAVLEQGEITQYGTHEELMAQGGTYAWLYNVQAQQYE